MPRIPFALLSLTLLAGCGRGPQASTAPAEAKPAPDVEADVAAFLTPTAHPRQEVTAFHLA